jgi:hypothetical protein
VLQLPSARLLSGIYVAVPRAQSVIPHASPPLSIPYLTHPHISFVSSYFQPLFLVISLFFSLNFSIILFVLTLVSLTSVWFTLTVCEGVTVVLIVVVVSFLTKVLVFDIMLSFFIIVVLLSSSSSSSSSIFFLCPGIFPAFTFSFSKGVWFSISSLYSFLTPSISSLYFLNPLKIALAK